ncbi:MAG: type II toxin-antitoxin system HicB family antitoxin [Bacteriovorax sp.]
MLYHFKIHKESDGYWAECLELEGCQTQSDTLSELKVSMEEVLNLYLSEPYDSKLIFPLPFKKTPTGKGVTKVHVDPSVAFSFLIRMTRIQNKLTLKEMAKKLNYKNINTYAKLEKAKTANPELRTIAKIKNVFSDFPINLILSS